MGETLSKLISAAGLKVGSNCLWFQLQRNALYQVYENNTFQPGYMKETGSVPSYSAILITNCHGSDDVDDDNHERGQ